MEFKEIYKKWASGEISNFEAHSSLYERVDEMLFNQHKEEPPYNDLKKWDEYLNSAKYKKFSSEFESCLLLADRIETIVCNNATRELYSKYQFPTARDKKLEKSFEIIAKDSNEEDGIDLSDSSKWIKFPSMFETNPKEAPIIQKKRQEADKKRLTSWLADGDLDGAENLFGVMKSAFFDLMEMKEKEKTQSVIDAQKQILKHQIRVCIDFLKELDSSL